jgi:hypothetical protein
LLPALFKREFIRQRFKKIDINAAPPVSAGGAVFMVLDDNITRKFPEGDGVYYVEEKYLVSKFLGD